MNIVDLFEYISTCWDHDNKNNLDPDQSVNWTLCKFLGVKDLINIQHLCRSGARLIQPEIKVRAVLFGNLDDSIRVNFWVMHAPFAELQAELKLKLKIGSQFTTVLQETLPRIKAKPLENKLKHQIEVDVKRTRCPQTDKPFGQEESKHLEHIL